MNDWCVYRHTAPDGRMYIGIAREPVGNRWQAGKGYKTNPDFWACIEEVGWENIQHEILISGLDRFEARKKESEYIGEYNTLSPNGFNRRRDRCSPYWKRLAEIGNKYGHAEVLRYWPDENRMKVYLMKCECGNEFVCKWSEISDDLSCGCKTAV